ncbi:hypothetical protein [Nocardioides sp. SYSU DS0663]|uniref:hypothetical protein n=1 Tax=Nocardioides sp. SYSU DS0663 TaxID=3416445 RepID=UPI003F4C643C
MNPWRLLRRWIIEGVTLNDDFANHASDVWPTLRRRRPAWIGVQEGKRRDYADDLPGRYGVVQRMGTEASEGVAVIYDSRQVKPIGQGVDEPQRFGHGYQQLTPAGGGILARGVAWQDVVVGGWGSRQQVRLATSHRHPLRERERWPEYDAALGEWIRQSPLPVWLATDANTKTPQPMARRLQARVRVHHVDAHFITGELRFASKQIPLKKRTSNHRAVAARVKVPRRKKENR